MNQRISPPRGYSLEPPAARRGAAGSALLQLLVRGLERGGASIVSLMLISLAGILGFVQLLPNALLVTGVTVAVTVEFTRRMDQGIPLMQLMAMIACLQWLVGPAVAYHTNMLVGRYSMYVDESSYFSFALPATTAFVVGALGPGASTRQRWLLSAVNRERFFFMGFLLNGIAFAAEYLAGRIPGGVAFFFHLLSQLHYVGALYFMLSNRPWAFGLALVSCFPLVLRSTESALFHDLILWAALLFCYWFASRPRSVGMKALALVAACCFVFTVQLVKQSYRDKRSHGVPTSYWEEMQHLWFDRQFDDSALPLALSRLNQGWIISAILANVPQREPFADGETVRVALASSLMPRFLWEDKKKAGGRENFTRFTGLQIADSTSMCISPLGESYANFGRDGGILFMAFYGLSFALIFQVAARHVLKHPEFFLWVPLVFYQAIKAETELAVVLNQIVKGSVVAFGLYYVLCQKLLPALSLRRSVHTRPRQPDGVDARRPIQDVKRQDPVA